MKTVKNRLFVILAGLFMASSAMVAQAATFKVTVPAGTNECYVVGNPNWSSFLKMNGSGTSFSLSTTAIDGTAFKYCSGPDWKYVEVKEDGTDLDNNRTSPGNPDVVAKWKNVYGPAPSAPELLLLSSISSFQTSEKVDKITLTAQEGSSAQLKGAYIWYQSTTKSSWVEIARGTSNTLELKGKDIPSTTMYYQVKRQKKSGAAYSMSNVRAIYVIQACGPDTKGKNLYKEDFGTLAGLKERSSFPGMRSNYTYRPYPQKINDGQYALVATPYYCGCGNGAGEEGEQSVETCEGNNMWFRQYLSDGITPMRDHTLNNLTAKGTQGAMLMINYATSGDKVAFQHVLTAEEKAQFSPNSILRFSAWFASAAKKEATAVLVNMALKIEFKAIGTSSWVEKASIITKVGYNEDWMRGEAELVLDEKDGDYRITIENYAGGGYGNDVLIDDISLDLCVPSFGLYFYEDGQDKASVTLENLSESVPIRVENMDFGSVGLQPCMMLFRYDAQAAQKYTYVGDMALDPSGKYYVFDVTTDQLSSIPGTTYFQAVASAAPCNPTIKDKVEKGTYLPGKQDDAIFSGNKATLTVNSDELTLKQAFSQPATCLNDTVNYTVTLKNMSSGPSRNIKVQLNWDSSVLEFVQNSSSFPAAQFNPDTQLWEFTKDMPKGAEVKLSVDFKIIKQVSATDPTICSSYVSSLGVKTWDSYEQQNSPSLRGQSSTYVKGLTITDIAVEPASESISIGSAITKQVSLQPAGVDCQITWYANQKNLSVPAEQALDPQLKPFVNTEYKIVAQNECGSVETTATAEVLWPTVFTPYTVDGKNDDFLSHMDPAFPIVIFDRYGNKIAETGDGWDGTMSNGKKAMPGVYFYIVTLPDGNLQKGTIEIYQD